MSRERPASRAYIRRAGYLALSISHVALVSKAFEDTVKHTGAPVQWTSRNEHCLKHPDNDDHSCVLITADACPRRNTTYTVVIVILKLVEWSRVEVEQFLNVGNYTSGAVRHTKVIVLSHFEGLLIPHSKLSIS